MPSFTSSFNLYIFTCFIKLTFLVSLTSFAQDWELTHQKDMDEKIYYFSLQSEAKSSENQFKQEGWTTKLYTSNITLPSKQIIFAEALDRNQLKNISEKLRHQKISHSIAKNGSKWSAISSPFFDDSILDIHLLKLQNHEVSYNQIIQNPPRMTQVFALQLNRPLQTKNWTSQNIEKFKSADFRFKYINEMAYSTNTPGSWHKAKNFFHFDISDKFKNNEWKTSFRLVYDATFDLEDNYPNSVKNDQQVNFLPNEIFWKHHDKNWYIKTGWLNLKWGNLIDAYVADVVSPKDLRDFILPRDENIDLPVLALNFHLNFLNHNFEVLWLPTPSTNRNGRLGSIFFPIEKNQYAPNTLIDTRPSSPKNEMGYGFRYSLEEEKFQGSLFYLKKVHVEPRYKRTLLSGNIASIEENHFMINQIGATFDLQLGKYDIHAEAVYGKNDWAPTTFSNVREGLVNKDTLNYAFQIKPKILPNLDLTLQYVVRSVLDHTPDLMVDENEQFATIDIRKFFAKPKLTPIITTHLGTQRGDNLLRPRIMWEPLYNLNFTAGCDIFSGKSDGIFGRYDRADRYYLETEYRF